MTGVGSQIERLGKNISGLQLKVESNKRLINAQRERIGKLEKEIKAVKEVNSQLERTVKIKCGEFDPDRVRDLEEMVFVLGSSLCDLQEKPTCEIISNMEEVLNSFADKLITRG